MDVLISILGFIFLLYIIGVASGYTCLRHKWYQYGTTDHIAIRNMSDGSKKWVSWKREHLRCSRCNKRKRGKKIDKY